MSELIDNREKRIGTLKTIIQKLHAGADPNEVRRELKEIVRTTDAGEIAAMEQRLIAEGMRVEEVRSMCDLHADVLQEVMTRRTEEFPPGHPLDTFKRENDALRSKIAELQAVVREIKALAPDATCAEPTNRWRAAVNELMDVDKHYQRKENLLFSCLERHGITGPSKVMWSKDDEARAALKALHAALNGNAKTAGDFARIADQQGDPALAAIAGMIQKEENILFPMSWQTLTAEEWGEIFQQSPHYGWCLVEPRTGYAPPITVGPSKVHNLSHDEAVMFPTGSLNLEQLKGIFTTLPLDMTFVDADDRVRFFSEGPQRIFARSKAIIGRKVQHCHPPSSVDVVERILADFHAGRQDVAEFWINHRGRYVHIRYFAVRDEAGQYLGTLELTQDIAPLRALEGERRLLQYN